MTGQQGIRREPEGAEADAEEMAPFLMALGEEIVEQRRFVAMSQEQLSELARCARRTLSLLEQGRRMPTTQILWRIARALDLELADLMEMAQDRVGQLAAPIPHRSGAEAALA